MVTCWWWQWGGGVAGKLKGARWINPFLLTKKLPSLGRSSSAGPSEITWGFLSLSCYQPLWWLLSLNPSLASRIPGASRVARPMLSPCGQACPSGPKARGHGELSGSQPDPIPLLSPRIVLLGLRPQCPCVWTPLCMCSSVSVFIFYRTVSCWPFLGLGVYCAVTFQRTDLGKRPRRPWKRIWRCRAGNSRVLGTPNKSRKGVWCVGGLAALGLWTPQPVGERYDQSKARLGSFSNKARVKG